MSTDTISVSSSETYAGSGNTSLRLYDRRSYASSNSNTFGGGGKYGTSTFTDTSAYSFTANACYSATGTSTASYSYYQAGSFGNGVFSFNSVTFCDQGTDSLSYGEGGTWTFSGANTL